MYLTPYATNIHDELKTGELGLLITPQSHRPDQYDVADFAVWAADNGCYTLGDRFDLDEFLGWLDSFTLAERRRCLFATAPDVVGDWDATLARSRPVLAKIRELGFPAAIVLQDGATVDSVPWDEIDAVFVGGSTEWKLGPEAEEILDAAEALTKWTHMGRVNSIKRMVEAGRMGAWSVDGTLLIFGPDANAPRIRKAVASTYEAHGDVIVPDDWNIYADRKEEAPMQVRNIRTTEVVTDRDGQMWPAGTEATSTPNERQADWDWEAGIDFTTSTGEVLWGLVPAQYEIEEEFDVDPDEEDPDRLYELMGDR